jgi:hypothetical protein
MWALNRVAPKRLVAVMAGLTAASFTLSCLWLSKDRSGDFYLPLTRAWELLAGSLLALGAFPEVRGRAWRQGFGLLGLLLIVGSFFFLNEAMPFPGYGALPVCLGAGLLIQTGGQGDTLSAKLLSLAPAVWVGLISYSLYLIHWPLIIFTRYQLLREPDLAEKLALLTGALLLAWISWRFVERPFRDGGKVARRWIFGLAGVGGAALLAAGGVAWGTNGLPQRFARYQVQIAEAQRPPGDATSAHCFLEGDWRTWSGSDCFLTQGAGSATLLWGDSHANHYAQAIRQNAGLFHESVLLFSTSSCLPVFGLVNRNADWCRGNNDQVRQIIQQYNIKTVILAAYWEPELERNHVRADALSSTVKQLQGLGVRVAVIGDNPDFQFANPAFLAIRLARQHDQKAAFYAVVRNTPGFNDRLRAATGTAGFFDPMPTLCRGDQCLVLKDGQPLMHDTSHFTPYGAGFLVKDIAALANGGMDR